VTTKRLAGNWIKAQTAGNFVYSCEYSHECYGNNNNDAAWQEVSKKVSKVKQSRYTPCRRLGGEEV
jgi:hypothetical protein